MTFLSLALGIGIGFGLWWLFDRFKPEEQTVCIMNCADGSTFRATCVSTQSTQCINSLQKKCG